MPPAIVEILGIVHNSVVPVVAVVAKPRIADTERTVDTLVADPLVLLLIE